MCTVWALRVWLHKQSAQCTEPPHSSKILREKKKCFTRSSLYSGICFCYFCFLSLEHSYTLAVHESARNSRQVVLMRHWHRSEVQLFESTRNTRVHIESFFFSLPDPLTHTQSVFSTKIERARNTWLIYSLIQVTIHTERQWESETIEQTYSILFASCDFLSTHAEVSLLLRLHFSFSHSCSHCLSCTCLKSIQ